MAPAKRPSNRPTTEDAITGPQLDFMLRGVLRIKDLFLSAKSRLRFDHFDDKLESPYRVMWKVVCRVATERGDAVLFDHPEKVRTLLETEIQAHLINHPDEMVPEAMPQLLDTDPKAPGLLPWIYTYSSDSELDRDQTLTYMRRFLNHRQVQEPLRRLLDDAGSKTITNFPAMLRGFVEAEQSISSVQKNPLRSVDPALWNPTPQWRYSTGVPFLDRILHGGHVGGEVYGVLGAYSSGKTAFATQLGCQSARAQYADLAGNPDYKPKHSYIFHYEATFDEMMSRVLSHMGEIQWDQLQAFDLTGLSSLSGPIHPKPYELIRWREAYLAKNGTFQAERERMNGQMSLYKDYIHLIDMSGTDPDLARQGTGYIEEITEILQTQAVSKGIPIGCVVIDYAGLACRRHISANNLPLESLRHLLADFGDRCRKQIAVPMKCPVWVFHQLAAAMNKRTYATVQHHSDAAESKSFAENLAYCFSLGVPHPRYRTILFGTSKARRTVPSQPLFLIVNGRFQKIEDAHPYFSINWSTYEVMPKDEAKRLGFVTEESEAAWNDTDPPRNGPAAKKHTPLQGLENDNEYVN